MARKRKPSKKKPVMPTDDKSEDSKFRVALAKAVTTWALVAILVIAALIIVAAGITAIGSPTKENTDRFFDIAKYVLGVLLPVIGAWVGTVLAFYFGQVNFRAASESAANLVRQLSPREKLQAKPVSGAMMKINDVTTFKIPADKTEADITIKQLIEEGFEKDKKKPRNRLPILDAEGRGKYVIHRSTVDAFVAPIKRPPDVDESTLTLKSLLEDPKVKENMNKSFMALSEDKTLADAKDILDKNPQCLDLLVTQDGTRNGVVVGWITNVDVLNAATI
jgi:CBS domain protein